MASWMGIAMALSLWSGPLVDGHVHKAPHSGVIAHAGPYHLELVISEDGEELWVLDKHERVLRPRAGTSLALTFEPSNAPASKAVKLVLSDDHFTRRSTRGRVPCTKTLVRADLVIGGKTLHAVFVYNLLDFRHRLWDV
jgi:hypothetical protein